MDPVERLETLQGELAERWSWQDGYRSLVFFLRKNVTWHDGHPFTARDVKFSFDVVREAADAPAKRRALVAEIQTTLEREAARSTMGRRLDNFAQWLER